MSLLDRLEPKLARFSIQNLPIALVVAWVIAFLLAMGQPQILSLMVLQPDLVMQGQVWRLVTFLLLPPVVPGSLTAGIFLFFACYLFWIFGGALEQQWGTFRFNVYLLIGWLMTVVAGMLQVVMPGAGAGGGMFAEGDDAPVVRSPQELGPLADLGVDVDVPAELGDDRETRVACRDGCDVARFPIFDPAEEQRFDGKRAGHGHDTE